MMRLKYYEEMAVAQQEAELTAIMAISKARDLGQIKKRNILKLDKKVNEAVNRFLATEGGQAYQITMPERLAFCGKAKLPAPVKRKRSDSVILTSEVERFARLPEDIREEERSRLHAFLLLRAEETQIGVPSFGPQPLVYEPFPRIIPELFPSFLH